jgi:regulator of PEP synthase PpsR (kinase-PPPase family)
MVFPMDICSQITTNIKKTIQEFKFEMQHILDKRIQEFKVEMQHIQDECIQESKISMHIMDKYNQEIYAWYDFEAN